jgi:hypothetical protein
MGSGLNGTGLSTFPITSTVLDFDELGAVLSEKLIGFWSSFCGSWFAAEGPDVDEFGRAYAHNLCKRGPKRRCIGVDPPRA